MAKHLIFLVHGMGDFSAGWSDGVAKQLKVLYGQYDMLSKLVPFDTTFEIKEINYNHCFEDLRDRWRTDSQAVLTALSNGKIPKSTVTEMAKYGGAGAADVFLATHVLDVFLYRFIPTVAERARVVVAKAILDALTAVPTDEVLRWSVIAHSLGTSITHDALHALYTDGNPPRLSPGTTRPYVLAMVSNVSRLLEDDVDVYRSVVHPSADPMQGVCDYYLNVRHEWDPIPRPKAFRPLDDWPDLLTRSQGRFDAIRINAFQSRDIHSLEHHLANPRVHVPLFRRLALPFLIPDDIFAKAVTAYDSQTPFGAFEKLQKKLKDLQLAEEASWTEVFKAFKEFAELVKGI